jgi:predicted aldo/keto reductase-like oxidoreductase
LSKAEFEAVSKVCAILRRQDLIACTACRYCEEGCPKKIAIPDLFSCLNAKQQGENGAEEVYAKFTEGRGKASDCIGCGKCEKACPQKLRIRTHLKNVAKQFD